MEEITVDGITYNTYTPDMYKDDMKKPRLILKPPRPSLMFMLKYKWKSFVNDLMYKAYKRRYVKMLDALESMRVARIKLRTKNELEAMKFDELYEYLNRGVDYIEKFT